MGYLKPQGIVNMYSDAWYWYTMHDWARWVGGGWMKVIFETKCTKTHCGDFNTNSDWGWRMG